MRASIPTCLFGLGLFALSACTSTATGPQPASPAGVAATTSEVEPLAAGTPVEALIAEQGKPDFVSRPGPRTRRLLSALGAEYALHFGLPDSANLSFAVGIRGGQVTRTVVFVDLGGAAMFRDPVAYFHAQARGEPVGWRPAGRATTSVAASAPRTRAVRLGSAFEPGE